MAKGKSDDKDSRKSAKDGKNPEAVETRGAKADAGGEKQEAKPDDKGKDNAKSEDNPEAKDDDRDGKKAATEASAPEPLVPPRPVPPVGTPTNGEPEAVELLPPPAIDTTVAPSTPAPAPGRAPRGDARSLRRGEEFCVIYRFKSHLIRRQGKIGTIGEWSVTEYPNQASAAHAYAQECSELTGDGFVDIR